MWLGLAWFGLLWFSLDGFRHVKEYLFASDEWPASLAFPPRIFNDLSVYSPTSRDFFILAFSLSLHRNDPFTKCHSSVDPSVFMKGCVASTCDCLREGKDEEECRCQALTHYVTRCLEMDSTIKLDDWRIVSKCCELWAVLTRREVDWFVMETIEI